MKTIGKLCVCVCVCTCMCVESWHSVNSYHVGFSTLVYVCVYCVLLLSTCTMYTRQERDDRLGRMKADGGVRNIAFSSRNAASRGLPTATPQSQISRDAKASARGALIANSGGASAATNGGMPSDYQVWRERGRNREK